MPTIVLGGSNGMSYDGSTISQTALAGKSNSITTASNALTLDVCSFDNVNEKFYDDQGERGLGGTDYTISSNSSDVTITSAQLTAGLMGGNVNINSGVYVYSTSTSTPALTLQVSGANIVNSGYIIGMGGDGGGTVNAAGRSGYDAGPAIKIEGTGCGVVNNSGGYIAGGGGGGGEWGGGGGAGGGRGGRGNHYTGSYSSLTGSLMAVAALNAVGANATYTGTASSQTTATGGGAGGGGGGGYDAGSGNTGSSGGGGGGRKIASGRTGGAGGSASACGGFGNRGCGGAGGSDGSSGSNYNGGIGSGGGGGWGAAGGNGAGGTGGAGGAAVDGNGNTYTLTNNGTVYGST